jgi:CBS domain containing-hemolysin-like protein
LGAVGENTFEALLEPVFHNLHLPFEWGGIEPILTALPLIISLIIVTSLHVVLGEQVPKVAALESPEPIAILSAGPMNWFSKIFTWFVDVLDWATQSILRLIGVKSQGGGHSVIYTVDELKQILIESEESGAILASHREMLHAVFDFSKLLVRQVMIPRTEVSAIPADSNLKESINFAANTRYTKFPVYNGDLDQIIGVVHIRDLLRAELKDPEGDLTAGDLARKPILIPEASSVWSLLNLFQKNRRHLAIVLDEYGGTAGLITLEDVLEEIAGEISGPFDDGIPEIQRINPTTVLVDGLTAIEDVNQSLGTNFQDQNYDTIAGFLLGHLDDIPVIGDAVNLEGDIRLEVTDMDGRRISRIQIRGV